MRQLVEIECNAFCIVKWCSSEEHWYDATVPFILPHSILFYSIITDLLRPGLEESGCPRRIFPLPFQIVDKKKVFFFFKLHLVRFEPLTTYLHDLVLSVNHYFFPGFVWSWCSHFPISLWGCTYLNPRHDFSHLQTRLMKFGAYLVDG